MFQTSKTGSVKAGVTKIEFIYVNLHTLNEFSFRLETDFQRMSNEHEIFRNGEESSYEKLKTQYEKDLQSGLLGLNKKYRQTALEEICSHATVGRKFCLGHQKKL